MDCPFCTLTRPILFANAYATAVLDKYPVSPWHTLVITSRHTASWFDLNDKERESVASLLDLVKSLIDSKINPDGYNVGFNFGEAAGQTIPHFHLHVIPRFYNDIENPSGGIRNVIPGKGNYFR